MSDNAVCINLSYVLHEPATSTVVVAYAARASQTRNQLDRATRRLTRLTDVAIAARTLVLAPSGEPPAGTAGSALTVQIGPWRLLRRVLTTRYRTSSDAWDVTLVDDPGCRSMTEAEFFRAPARLCLPVAEQRPAGWFATLTLRPGGDGLLLELMPLAANDTSHSVVAAAEAAIRSHVGQWTCAAALWPRPAEDQLPEFRDG